MEAAFKAVDYKIRYERGTFKSGYCVLADQNVVVINKFYPLESKVAALAEIMLEINPGLEGLEPAQVKLFQQFAPPTPASPTHSPSPPPPAP